MSVKTQIRQKGLELGFDRVGFTTADPLGPDCAAYHERWLAAGCAARMRYLYRNNDKRFAPARLLDGAQSVVCVALNYRPRPDELPDGLSPPVARYALYDDYHGFIKSRLLKLADFIRSLRPDTPLRCKACVDAIPLAERLLARRAGLGFIGRNHALINPELGGMLFLGELLTTLPLPPDTPLDGTFCTDCNRCIAACPTGALGSDGTFDARKCLSYLTIEEPDDIDPAFAAHLDRRLFGCDACLTACPFEKNAPPRTNIDLAFHPERLTLKAEHILTWTDARFNAAFENSPFERLGLRRLQRNARLSLDRPKKRM